VALTRFPALAALSVASSCAPGSARAAATDWVGDSRAAVRLESHRRIISLPIQPSKAGLEFRFAKGWHGYWRTPGDAASHPRLTGPLQKISLALKFPGLLHIVSSSRNWQNSVYENDVVLPVKITSKASSHLVRVKASIEYGRVLGNLRAPSG